MYKHIIFDFDGTLVDSTNIMMKILNDLAQKYNFKKLSENDYKQLNSLPIKERFKVLGIPFYRLLFLKKVSEEIRETYKNYLYSIKFFSEVQELLLQLKELGFSLSIISSNSIDNISQFLKQKNIHLFDSIHSSEGIFGKSRTLKKFLKNNNLNHKEIIYVGDEFRDILSCKKSNIDIISVTWGLDSRDLLQSVNPTYLVDKRSEIIDIIKKR